MPGVGLRRLRLLFHQPQQSIQLRPVSATRRLGRSSQPRLRLLDRLHHPLSIERLQQIIDRIHLERAHSILVERRRKHHLGNRHLAVQQLLQHAKSVQTRHLNIQKHQVRLMRPDQFNRLDSIGSLRENFDSTSSLQQILQLLPGQRFVIDDECSQ